MLGKHTGSWSTGPGDMEPDAALSAERAGGPEAAAGRAPRGAFPEVFPDMLRQLVEAHLALGVQVLQAELRGRGIEGAFTPTLLTHPLLLQMERDWLELLVRHHATLSREVRFRFMGDARVRRLEEEAGLQSSDAVPVHWFPRSEAEDAGAESLMDEVAAAYSHIMSGREVRAGFPAAVALAATRKVRRSDPALTWKAVEREALRILHVASA